MKIALGVEIWALELSSAMWKGMSKPDIVHMTARKVMSMQIPSGQSVKFSMPQAFLLLLNFGNPRFVLLFPARMMIQEMKRNAMFKMDVQEFIRAIQRVGQEAMHAQVKVMPMVSKYVCQVF